MKKYLIVATLAITILACSFLSTTPTEAPMIPTNTIGATNTQKPTYIPLPTRTPKLVLPTPTPEIDKFIYYLKDNLNFYFPKLDLNATAEDVYYADNAAGGKTLWIVTKCGVTLITYGDIYVTTMAILMSQIDGNTYPIPSDLDSVYFSFLGNDLIEKGHFSGKWSDVLALSMDDITEAELHDRSDFLFP